MDKLKITILIAIATTTITAILLTTSDINVVAKQIGATIGGIIGLNAGISLATKKKKVK